MGLWTRLLRPGEPVPAFRLEGHDGRVYTREDLLGRPCVLWFYPADETPGCTREGCAYRDLWETFDALGVAVLGVSRDAPGRHQAFAARQGFPFVLLSDPDGGVHRAFGAVLPGGLPRRVSYLVDREGRVAARFSSHLRPQAHATRMLEAARSLVK